MLDKATENFNHMAYASFFTVFLYCHMDAWQYFGVFLFCMFCTDGDMDVYKKGRR